MNSQRHCDAVPDVSLLICVYIVSDVPYVTFTITNLQDIFAPNKHKQLQWRVHKPIVLTGIPFACASARLGLDSITLFSVCRRSFVTEPRDSITVQVCSCAFYRLFHISSRRGPYPSFSSRSPRLTSLTWFVYATCARNCSFCVRISL